MSRGGSVTVPDCNGQRPDNVRRRELFPLPLGPSIITEDPGGTFRLKSCTSRVPSGAQTETWSSSMFGPLTVFATLAESLSGMAAEVPLRRRTALEGSTPLEVGGVKSDSSPAVEERTRSCERWKARSRPLGFPSSLTCSKSSDTRAVYPARELMRLWTTTSAPIDVDLKKAKVQNGRKSRTKR